MSEQQDPVRAVEEALAAPFAAGEVKWKPAMVKANRALALAYVDARIVQDRLDEVLGVAGWQDEYELLPSGSVVCRLSCRVAGEWLTKTDVGSESEQPDGGDRTKAAFSDALKRAAVKWGVGRYLYSLPSSWVDYDPQKKQLKPPQLPAWALPAAPKAAANGHAPAAKAAPKDGAELRRRLLDYEGRLARQGLCQPGDLVKHVVAAGVDAGYTADLLAWTAPAIELAVRETRAFEAAARQPKPAGRDPAELVEMRDLQDLIGRARKRGYDEESLLVSCKQKWGVAVLQDLTVGQYREAIALLDRQRQVATP